MRAIELLAKLQDMIDKDPTVGELRVLTEGCDCVDECGDLDIEESHYFNPSERAVRVVVAYRDHTTKSY